MEAWLNPSDVTARRAILEFALPNGRSGVHLWLGVGPGGVPSPGAVFANLRDAQLIDHVINTDPDALPANKWTHVVLTFDQPSGQAVIYVNGAPTAAMSLGIFTPQTPLPLYLGIRPPNSLDYFGAPPFAGLIDEVTLYNRALDATEVSALFNAGASGKCTDTPFITTTMPFDAALGVNYSGQIYAELGTAPYTFTLADGHLPPGLNLATNGILSGVPTQSGQFEFTVRATDALDHVAFRKLPMRVQRSAATPIGLVSWWPANGSGKDIADLRII